MRKQNQTEALLDWLGYYLCKEKKKEEKDASKRIIMIQEGMGKIEKNSSDSTKLHRAFVNYQIKIITEFSYDIKYTLFY